MILKYLKSYAYTLAILLIGIIIITIINYITSNTLNYLKTTISIIAIFIGSFILGKNSNKKGYIEGLKFGIIYIILLLLLNLILIKNFTIKTIIYYIMLIISSILGSMIGINIKKQK